MFNDITRIQIRHVISNYQTDLLISYAQHVWQLLLTTRYILRVFLVHIWCDVTCEKRDQNVWLQCLKYIYHKKYSHGVEINNIQSIFSESIFDFSEFIY